MVPTDERVHILTIYGDYIEVFSTQGETLLPHWSIRNEIGLEPSYNLPNGRITVQLNGDELNGIQLTGVELIGVESNGVKLSGVVHYSCNCMESDHVLKHRIIDWDLD